MPRLWICGIMQNNANEVRDILEPLEPFLEANKLGAFWIDGGSTDQSIEEVVGWGGCVKVRRWTNDHDFQMNEYLRDPRIKHGDWVIQCDTSERIHPEFIEKLLDVMLDNFEKQGINTVYQRSKPMLFRKFDDQFFMGTPHWGLQGQRQQAVDIAKFDGFEDDKTYCWSNRDDINKWILNGIKYYYCYGRSNHMWLVYNPANYPGTTDSLIQQHEARRQAFRHYCRTELGLPMDNTDALKVLMKSQELPEKLVEFIKYEKVLANYYRYVNGEDQQVIYDTQNSWKFVETPSVSV
jgi:glycosyltransferase involved in cell wall biosynthesis